MTSVGNNSIVICGAGIVGCATAYYLKELGCSSDVTVVDSMPGPASQASGKAGGFLARGWSSTHQFDDLTRLSYSLHQKLSSELGCDTIGYRPLTTLSLDIQQDCHHKEVENEGVEWIKGRKDAEVIGTDRDTSQVHPKLLTQALLRESSAKFVQGTVTGIELLQGGRVTGVKLDSGVTLPANIVLIALGPWTSKAGEWLPKAKAALARAFHTERAHSVVLKVSEVPPPEAIFVNRYKKCADDIEVYPRPDATVYSCGYSDDPAPFPPDPKDVTYKPESCEKIVRDLRDMMKLGPGLSSITRQAYYLPWSADAVPVIGHVPGHPGAFVAAGHGCWGILNGPGTGLCAASIILGLEAPVDIRAFTLDRFN